MILKSPKLKGQIKSSNASSSQQTSKTSFYFVNLDDTILWQILWQRDQNNDKRGAQKIKSDYLTLHQNFVKTGMPSSPKLVSCEIFC